MDISDTAKKHSEWVDEQDWEKTTVLEKLALVSSEVGEAVNECRGEDWTNNFPLELADIILRVFHLAEKEDIDIEEAIQVKMDENFNRKGRTKRKIK